VTVQKAEKIELHATIPAYFFDINPPGKEDTDKLMTALPWIWI
jgi:hypothetical protein